MTELSNAANTITVIRAGRKWTPLSFKELWQYRHFFSVLASRDIIVRYKQTVVGVAWAVVQPLVMMLLLTVFFGHWVQVSSGGLPYPVFVYAGLLSWYLFARGLSATAGCLVTNEGIITKVYFPRVLVPAATIATGLLDYALAFVFFVPILFWYDVGFSWRQLVFPFFVVLNIFTTLGIGLFLCVLDALYRDVRFALGFITQILLFATPVIYSSDVVPEKYQILFWLNPMAGVVEGTRWSLLNYELPNLSLLLMSMLMAVGLFLFGLLFFLKTERKIVDRI